VGTARLRPGAADAAEAAPAPPRRGWRSRPELRVAAVTAALTVATVAVQAGWLRAGLLPAGRGAGWLVAVAVLFAAAERFVVTFPVRRGSHTISLSEIPLVLGLVTTPPVALVAARVAAAVIGLTVFRRQRGGKLAFNLALYAAQVTVATAVFRAMVQSFDHLGPRGWTAAFAATFAADLISVVLVTTAIALHDDSTQWRRMVGADLKRVFQLPLVAVTTALALLTALVVREQVQAAALLAVLAYAAYRVFHRYAQQTQGHAQVEALYAFTSALGDSVDSAEVVRTVLSRVRDLLRARSAELLVFDNPRRSGVRIRMAGEEDVTTRSPVDADGAEWWRPALAGAPVLTGTGRSQPDAMAVPVRLDEGVGVLLVGGPLADTPAFTPEHLKLMGALAAHAGVALTNVYLVDRLLHTASHDALTQLPNRGQFHADVERALAARTGPGDLVTVLLLDVDRFKEVNDALGHDIGDELLRRIGRRLQDAFGSGGTVARLGGDEFAVLFTGAGSEAAAVAVAQDLRRAMERPIQLRTLSLTVQASIGVSVAPGHGDDADRLLQRADVAMYVAKQARAGVRLYQPEDDRNTRRRLTLMVDLRDAIERRAITVVFQPKVAPGSGRVLGAEALSRWRRGGELVPPDEFIPLAERSDLIRPLTVHVLDVALAACARWRGAGHDLSVAVNLSPNLLADPALVEEVGRALRRHGLPTGALILEITENGVMADPAGSRSTLTALHALGVRLSIDDFGTGHSSLGRLAELPIDEVKIDKGFVQGMAGNPGMRAVTDAAVQLGHALDLTVVAEGVEREAELEYLHRRGCDAVQGFHIARPMPADDFAPWLDGWTGLSPAGPATARLA
jgi:diguanylate cyclase (GGDEF)-like protein